jgi:hypothetical protein
MKTYGLLAAFFFLGAQAWATPAQVLLIRHGEKPDSGKDLSVMGEERARALVDFFQEEPEVTDYGPPVAIFAMAGSGDQTRRPVETVEPLAKALGLELREVAENQAQSMVHSILTNPAYDGKMVLICWVHEEIPAIAHLLGATQAPNQWDEKAFDRVWEINYSDGQVSSFKDLPQDLMPGDSDH